VLLEALCFDFFVENPHAELVDLFESCECPQLVQEYAWSLAHDSSVHARYHHIIINFRLTPQWHRYRTPLCVLYPPRIIATACCILAQRIHDGPNSPSLDARISATSPASHLPTPPSHKPPSPDATRVVVERYAFTDQELVSIASSYPFPLCLLHEWNSTFPLWSCSRNNAWVLSCSGYGPDSVSLEYHRRMYPAPSSLSISHTLTLGPTAFHPWRSNLVIDTARSSYSLRVANLKSNSKLRWWDTGEDAKLNTRKKSRPGSGANLISMGSIIVRWPIIHYLYYNAVI